MKLYTAVALAAGVGAGVVGCSDGPDCGGGACVACMASNPFSCTGETVCVDEVCQPAFGRSYVFTVTTGTLPQVDDMGASWDEGGGLPDPLAELTINGTSYTSPTIVDSLAPVWNFATPAVPVPAGSTLRLRIYDDDEPMDDLAWTCTSDPLPIEYLRAGFGCSGPGSLPGARANVTVAAQPD